jgi:hypothetical protein
MRTIRPTVQVYASLIVLLVGLTLFVAGCARECTVSQQTILNVIGR